MGNLLWVASYPKSGNTWMRAFIENYLQNLPRPVDINRLFKLSTAEAKADRFQAYVEKGQDIRSLTAEEICAIRPLVQAKMARQAKGTIFVKTHNYLGEFGGFPLHNSAATSGAIYIVRNPLDVVISMANYFDYTIDEAIDYMAREMTATANEKENVPQIISSWSTNVQSWTRNPEQQILVLRYEDMLSDPLKAFRKVVSLLGQRRDLKRLKKAISFSSFDQLRAQERQHGFVEKHENANSFFRRGRKNQWQQKLTKAQVRRIIEKHESQMKRFHYLTAGLARA